MYMQIMEYEKGKQAKAYPFIRVFFDGGTNRMWGRFDTTAPIPSNWEFA